MRQRGESLSRGNEAQDEKESCSRKCYQSLVRLPGTNHNANQCQTRNERDQQGPGKNRKVKEEQQCIMSL